MNALKMVEKFSPVEYSVDYVLYPSCILKCFAHKYDPKQQKVIYITESVSDNVMRYLLWVLSSVVHFILLEWSI